MENKFNFGAFFVWVAAAAVLLIWGRVAGPVVDGLCLAGMAVMIASLLTSGARRRGLEWGSSVLYGLAAMVALVARFGGRP